MANRAGLRQTSKTGRSPSLEPASQCGVDMDDSGSDTAQHQAHESELSKLKGDYGNVALLLLLYMLQGLPMGLAAAVPMLLKEKHASMSEIGTFSLSSLPYSLKLLWAPIVDAVFIPRIGRRKTWMIPSQLAIGTVLLLAPFQQMLDDTQITPLTGVFLLLYFLCATQDIAVDGWALTMLQKRNVGYASTCNSAGQSFGFFLSFTGYLALTKYGYVDLDTWCQMCGVSFILITLCVWALKTEKQDTDIEGIFDTYKALFNILCIVPVRKLVGVCLLMGIPFSAFSLAGLELQEYGFPKEDLALISALAAPVTVLTPLVLSKYVSGTRPFSVAVLVYVPRMMVVVPTVFLVWQASHAGKVFSNWFYGGVVLLVMVEHFLMTALFTSKLALFARVADPQVGGTYMTLLNTMSNCGSLWVATASLKLVDFAGSDEVGGFYTVVGVSMLAGVLWFSLFGRRQMVELDLTPPSEWVVVAPAARD